MGLYWNRLLKRIIAATRERGAQSQLARDVGVGRQAVNKWINGQGEPSAEILLRVLEWVECAESRKNSK